MAEIKIEKKATLWPWLLAGLLVIVGIVYFLFYRNSTDNVGAQIQDSTGLYQNDNALSNFVEYIEGDTTAMGLDHEYTHAGLIKLADATEYIANKTGFAITSDINQAREFSDKITDDPMVNTHADNIKRATNILSTSLLNIQQAKFPDLSVEAGKLKSSSKAIDVDELTLNQKSVVKTFFTDAADLLRKMN